MLVNDAAAQFGVSRSTLKRWRKRVAAKMTTVAGELV